MPRAALLSGTGECEFLSESVIWPRPFSWWRGLLLVADRSWRPAGTHFFPHHSIRRAPKVPWGLWDPLGRATLQS